MTKRTEAPKTKASPRYVGDKDSTVTTHPAFAQISAGRVQGSAHLYGSDFNHQHFIRLEIKRSQLHRDLSRDWYFAHDSLIEVWLSEAQWATFIGSLNMGGGTPCTLNWFNGDVPGLPPPEATRQEQFAAEMAKRLQDARDLLRDLTVAVESTSLSRKAKDELLRIANRAAGSVGSSVDFVAEQFGEHMEKVTEDAKTEIEAYVHSTIQRAGITALGSGSLPIVMVTDRSRDITPEE